MKGVAADNRQQARQQALPKRRATSRQGTEASKKSKQQAVSLRLLPEASSRRAAMKGEMRMAQQDTGAWKTQQAGGKGKHTGNNPPAPKKQAQRGTLRGQLRVRVLRGREWRSQGEVQGCRHPAGSNEDTPGATDTRGEAGQKTSHRRQTRP